MSKLLGSIVSILLVLALTTPCLSSDLSKSYTPTRKEWLEIQIHNRVKHLTDIWKSRIAFAYAVYPEDNQIIVTITSPNGQPKLRDETQIEYMKAVKQTLKNLVKRYRWANELTIKVQFI